MKKSKISIITVVLNGEKTIEQTIQSVISQSYENIEYIIIDGKSSDGTIDIIKKYKKYINIFKSEKDEGIYNAMNKGLSLSSGEIIGFINSDDWYEPNIIERVYKKFLYTEAEVIYGRLNLVDENENKKVLKNRPIENMVFEMAVPHPTVFIKKGVYEKFGGFNEKYRIAADYELMLRLYISGVKFSRLDEIVANFRLTGISSNSRECKSETEVISENYFDYNVLGAILDDLRGNISCPVLIYGAGYWGEWLINKFEKLDINELCIADKNKSGLKMHGIMIKSIEDVYTFQGVIVVSIYESDIIVKDIQDHNKIARKIVSIKDIMNMYKVKMKQIISG